MYIRNLIKGELLPVSLPHGYPIHWAPPQPEWIWIAYSDSHDPLGLLMAAPAQGVVLVMRVCASAHAPKSILVNLFRHSVRDVLKRGYTGYLTFLNPNRPYEAKLLTILKMANGNSEFSQTTPGTVMVIGPIDKLRSL